MKNKRITFFLTSFLMLTFMFISGNIKVNAATVSRVYYSTDNSPIELGQPFNIFVNCENIKDLYGASVDFKYDASMLQILDITEGDVFYKSKKPYNVLPVSNTTGIVSMALSLQGDVPGFTGVGKVFTIKVRALKTGLVSLKTTNDSSKLDVSGLNMCIKLADATTDGKITNVAYEPLNVSIIPKNVVPAQNTQRFEESNSKVVNTGTWVTGVASYVSGGTAKNSNVINSSSEFKFTGTGIRWISYLASNRGKAKVYVDNRLITIADTYATSGQAQKVAFQKLDLTFGSHTIKIVVTGTRRLASTGNYITVDAYDVVQFPASQRFEEANSKVVNIGTWVTGVASYISGGTAKNSNVINSSSEFKFTGTGIRWISYLASNRGKAKVYVDNRLITIADTYSATGQAQKVAFQKLDLPFGAHTIKIVVTGTRRLASTGNYITVDAYDVLNR